MRYYTNNVFFGHAATAVLGDSLAFGAAATLTWFFFAPPFAFAPYAGAALLGWFVVFLVLHFFELYSLQTLGSGRTTIFNSFAAMGAVAGLFGAAYFAVPLPQGALESAAQTCAVFFPIQMAGRTLYRRLISVHRDRVLVIGAGDLGLAIGRFLTERKELGVNLVGFLSDNEADWGSAVEGAPVFGATHLAEKVIAEENVQRVVVASKRRGEEFPADALLAAKLSGVRVESGVSFYERATGHLYIRDLRASDLIFSDGFRPGWFQAALKRVLDATVATLGLLLVGPLLAIAALAIKLDSRGPIFFRQARQGRSGTPFVLYKLRTMCCDAERDTGAVWASEDDCRITRVGRFLRRSRLDETPQFWNVLRGDMSVVGPRPERQEFLDTLSGLYPLFRVRSAVKPGITGWAQIRHGYVGDTSGYEQKLGLDLYYVKNRSLGLDLLVLWRTIKTVLALRGL